MKLALALLLLATPAFASQELTHVWRQAKVTVATGPKLFGDVEVTATATDAGIVQTISVAYKGKTIAVPAKLIEAMPKVPLASLEVRTEPGYDPEPWLYVVFKSGPTNVKDAVQVHYAFQGTKMKDASIDTFDGKGGSKHEIKKAP